METEYDWSVTSALWQIEHGEPGDRRRSAFDFLLDVLMHDKPADHLMIAAGLLARLRGENA